MVGTYKYYEPEKISILVRNGKCKNIKQFSSFAGCYCVGNGSIQRMAVNCYELKELYLRDCHWLSREGALVISFNCKKLEKLDLTGCWELGDDSVISIVLCCQRYTSQVLLFVVIICLNFEALQRVVYSDCNISCTCFGDLHKYFCL